MKINLGKQTYLFPMPVLILVTYDENGKADAMNAAWGGIHDTNQVHLCLSSDHKTTENIKAKKALTISFATKETIAESDYFGLVSGNQVPNKIDIAHFRVSKSEHVDAPVIEEYPVTLECEIAHLEDDGAGTTFVVANIVNVLVDEKVLNEKHSIDYGKFLPLIYDPVHHGYYIMGEKVGNAFQDGRKFQDKK